jgi:omega-amidase
MENSVAKNILAISLVQANTKYDSIEGNLAHLEELIDSNPEKSDIYLLPELFNTGYQKAFSTRPEMLGLYTTRWMRQMAERKKAAICGSIAISESEKTYNRMLFVSPDGKVQWYDKINVFKFSGEDKVFSAGERQIVFEFLGWKIKPIICFDLRFPESVRNLQPWYDLILCSAHWPEPRIAAWDTLLKARAIENQSYLAAVNRYGNEGDSLYPGHSGGFNFLGESIGRPMVAEEIQTISFDKQAQNTFRNRFPFLEN